jgi:hypothetical protein
MRSTAGVLVDEKGSLIDAVTVRFDLFGNMFLEQGVGDCVAFTPMMQDQLVEAIVARRKKSGEQPSRLLAAPAVSIGVLMSITMAMVNFPHCWPAKYPASPKTTQTVLVADDRKGTT